jgi:hypothetical protein
MQEETKLWFLHLSEQLEIRRLAKQPLRDQTDGIRFWTGDLPWVENNSWQIYGRFYALVVEVNTTVLMTYLGNNQTMLYILYTWFSLEVAALGSMRDCPLSRRSVVLLTLVYTHFLPCRQFSTSWTITPLDTHKFNLHLI